MSGQITRNDTATYTIISVVGHVEVETLNNGVEEYYKTRKFPRTIWDFSNAKLENIKISQLSDIVNAVKTVSDPVEEQMKVALLFGNEYDEVLGNVFEAVALSADIKISYQIFKTLIEAESWVQE